MKYDAILNAPHWNPRSRPRIPMEKRAAQFQPFDPLEGYSDAIVETARETDAERWLDETSIDAINQTLSQLRPRLKDRPTVSATWFEADSRKSGGAYRTTVGVVKKLDEYIGQMVFEDGTAVPLASLFSLCLDDEELPIQT